MRIHNSLWVVALATTYKGEEVIGFSRWRREIQVRTQTLQLVGFSFCMREIQNRQAEACPTLLDQV